MATRRRFLAACSILVGLSALSACGGDPERTDGGRTLRLATTTSTRDSGLLDELIPPFEAETGCRVEVIAVGTGAALRLGAAGDVDAVLVHAREAEEAFLAAGHASRHEEFMVNFFMIAGPAGDPAAIAGLEPGAAMKRLATVDAAFVSRGDDSGTHQREKKLRALSGVEPWPALIESGQGMGASLLMADELNAHVLCDAGTWARMAGELRLKPLVVAHAALRNPYAVMPVSSSRHPGVREELANRWADYLISRPAQGIVRDFRVAGVTLFEPLRLEGNDSNH